MDTVTIAILAALASGITLGAAKVGEEVISDAYQGLKSLIRNRFGSEGNLAIAIEALEANPTSESRKLTLAEEVEKAKADQDPVVLKAAADLIKHIEARPDGQKLLMNIRGNRSVGIGGNVLNSTIITGDRNNKRGSIQ